jgi:hypothetical protein
MLQSGMLQSGMRRVLQSGMLRVLRSGMRRVLQCRVCATWRRGRTAPGSRDLGEWRKAAELLADAKDIMRCVRSETVVKLVHYALDLAWSRSGPTGGDHATALYDSLHEVASLVAGPTVSGPTDAANGTEHGPDHGPEHGPAYRPEYGPEYGPEFWSEVSILMRAACDYGLLDRAWVVQQTTGMQASEVAWSA